MRARQIIGAGIATFLFPLALFAQTQSEELRTQIRADILEDPRASQISEEELSALVNALATQAEEDGTAQEYLESHETFDYSSLFEEPAPPSFLATALTSPLTLALIFLLVVLFAVALYIFRRKGTSSDMPGSNIEA